ncbi:Na(+)/H(+) antiporter 1 [Eremomyces bilateralis CBS 781.70]|uniref:Na(+)/H(+) antiporter 1 n=1 Tax=Eremomyces bilateralis CBS 781.70 TaxID=1392243 RepID=A0A6G1GHA7_9PEZI|nr:Na(+)/H(+) antiporter 1 [Eremomyces bilateralis CBS 781.70]KAF1817458.1 Na(+)/H(+) antiporter 1 [Eremomyces bilateralis CBS 781.70]
MPSLDVSELNVILAILGAFTILYGFISTKIKMKWYLGEALPAVVFGIILGPIASKFIDATRWGVAAPEQQNAITLGVCRVVIGVQLVIAGYQLPTKYQLTRWKEMFICLIPIMTIMWLCTTGCIIATVPNLTLLAALVIGSCVTCTDPILSQAIAKGPFADKFVARDLREIISSEAGANDGFGFPFLMLAVYLIRYANVPGAGVHSDGAVESAVFSGISTSPVFSSVAFPTVPVVGVPSAPTFTSIAAPIPTAMATGLPTMNPSSLLKREADVGRLGGGVGKALLAWFIETWLYVVLMSVAYGIVTGYGSCLALKYALRKKWIDAESYALWPTALGLFIVGTCGALGTDDLLACFVAGNALNWDGGYLEEIEARHDEVNSCVDVLLNFGGFMYIGSILPWSEFHQPDTTGITYPRLIALGVLVLILRRIPAVLITYKLMPRVCKNIKEALFMGYFGPIGIGAVFYLEHTRHLFPELGKGDKEENSIQAAIGPIVYWLVLFSIVVHGLSIPALNLIYSWMGVKPIQEDAVELKRLSLKISPPRNSVQGPTGDTFIQYNRFSRPTFPDNVVLGINQSSTWDSFDGEDDEKPLRPSTQRIRWGENTRPAPRPGRGRTV